MVHDSTVLGDRSVGNRGTMLLVSSNGKVHENVIDLWDDLQLEKLKADKIDSFPSSSRVKGELGDSSNDILLSLIHI